MIIQFSYTLQLLTSMDTPNVPTDVPPAFEVLRSATETPLIRWIPKKKKKKKTSGGQGGMVYQYSAYTH